MNEQDTINLIGKVCPYPVVDVVRYVDQMKKGETITFQIDDPLAVKSVPEELEEYPDISFAIDKEGEHWNITVANRPSAGEEVVP